MKQTEGRKPKKVHEPIVDLDGEVWKDVVGYEGLYQVSNMGRIKSLKYKRRNIPHITNYKPNQFGYIRVQLTKNGERKGMHVHRLVYEAFVGKVPKWIATAKGDERMEINHKDENKSNNCVWNLELITAKENVNYGTGIARRSKTQTNKRNSKKVYQYTTCGELVKIWPSTMECNRNGFYFSNVAACCVGRRKHYKGFLWSYEPMSKEQCYLLRTYNDYAVYQYTKNGELIKKWKNASECERNGYNKVCVRRCCRGKQSLHKGYIWSKKLLENK